MFFEVGCTIKVSVYDTNDKIILKYCGMLSSIKVSTLLKVVFV